MVEARISMEVKDNSVLENFLVDDEPCMALEEPVMCVQISKSKPIEMHDDLDSDDEKVEQQEVKVEVVTEEPKVEVKLELDVALDARVVECEIEPEVKCTEEIVVTTEVIADFKDVVVMSNKEDVDQVQDDAVAFDHKEFKKQDTMEPMAHDKPSVVISEVESESPLPQNVDLLAESQITESEETPIPQTTPKPEDDSEWKEELFVNGDKYVGYFLKGKRNGKGNKIFLKN